MERVGVEKMDCRGLKASQYAATDGTTNLVSTQNGNNWTNTIAWTHQGTTTNITATVPARISAAP